MSSLAVQALNMTGTPKTL